MTYINLDEYDKQWDKIDNFMNKTEKMCISIQLNVDNNCGDFLTYTTKLLEAIETKKTINIFFYRIQ